jgi:hypothetical protein
MQANVAELIEKLVTATIKLYKTCDAKALCAADPDKFTKEQIVQILNNDIELCRERANLKNAINKALGVGVTNEIKDYGQ